MCGIRDCGSSPRRPTNDWANRKLPRNVAVARRNLPAEVPPSRLPRLPRSASTIGRHLEQSLLTLSCLAVLPCDSSYSDRPAPAKARTCWASRPPLFALKPNFLGAPCSCPHGGGGNSESLAQPLLGPARVHDSHVIRCLGRYRRALCPAVDGPRRPARRHARSAPCLEPRAVRPPRRRLRIDLGGRGGDAAVDAGAVIDTLVARGETPIHPPSLRRDPRTVLEFVLHRRGGLCIVGNPRDFGQSRDCAGGTPHGQPAPHRHWMVLHGDVGLGTLSRSDPMGAHRDSHRGD